MIKCFNTEITDFMKSDNMSSGILSSETAVNTIMNAVSNFNGHGVVTVMVQDTKEVKNNPNGKAPISESGLSLREGRDNNIKNSLSLSTWRMVEIGLAEVVGTGCLMFFGCMGTIGETSPVQSALVFGLVVCTIVQIFGHISSAHLNPVVTVIAIVLGKITPATAITYFIAEFTGAVLGFNLLKTVTPCDLWEASSGNGTGVCSTTPIPSLTDCQALALEFFATGLLTFAICSVWDERNADKSDSIPLKFGAIITVISITVGPFTGASMNPVRTLAPALVNGVWTKHWIYWIGPLGAGFLVSVFYQLMFDPKQRMKSEVAEEVPLTCEGVIVGDSKNAHNIRQSQNTLNEL